MPDPVPGKAPGPDGLSRKNFLDLARIIGTGLVLSSCLPGSVRNQPTPEPVVTPNKLPTKAAVVKPAQPTQKAEATEVPKTYSGVNLDIDYLKEQGKKYQTIVNGDGGEVILPQLSPVGKEVVVSPASLTVYDLMKYTIDDWSMVFPDGYDGTAAWFSNNKDIAKELLSDPKFILLMELSMMSYRGINGGIGRSGNQIGRAHV